MKRVRLERWGAQLLTARSTSTSTSLSNSSSRPCCLQLRKKQAAIPSIRANSAWATRQYNDGNDGLIEQLSSSSSSSSESTDTSTATSPPPSAALQSSKLASLHARLNLPSSLPLQTLARALVDPSADSNKNFNNHSLAQIGGSIISYHVSEWLICTYPRLPMTVLFAATYAYNGPKTLRIIAEEWGVESAASPGIEVDAGLLQFERLAPGQKPAGLEGGGVRPDDKSFYRRGISSRVVYDDEFGDTIPKSTDPTLPIPTEGAYATFVKAVVGAIYLHSGREASKTFVKQHILSRYLTLSTLFQFKDPVRELSRLCAREAFEYPVARILSETGRLSRHPVFVVGIFSGADKLGEGTSGNLKEARTRAAVAALKAWYLYSPGKNVRVPSDVEGRGASEKWEPVHVDMGEIIH